MLDTITGLPLQVGQAAATAGAASTAKVTQQDCREAFQQLLDSMRQLGQMETQRIREKADEKKAEAAEQDRNERIQELYALIAQLKTQLINSGGSPRIAAQLSAAQNELFLLLMAI